MAWSTEDPFGYGYPTARRKRPRRVSRAALVCLFAGLVLTAGGLTAAILASSAYRVEFGDPGQGCATEVINLDESTGERLLCSRWALDESDTPFTLKEEERVEALAQRLGGDSEGLSDRDKATIEHLVYSIGAEHGDPNETYNPKGGPAGSPGHIAFLVGVVLSLVGSVWTLISYTRAH